MDISGNNITKYEKLQRKLFGNFEGNFQKIENICDVRNRKLQLKNDNNLIDNNRIIFILEVFVLILFGFCLQTFQRS